jgi:coatomer protein complex subunit gamma
VTESETEYKVECVKHIFEEHVLFQFTVSNTVEDQMLENVTMQMEGDEEVGLYPIVTFQYSSTTLYQASYHIQYLFF